jgi:hypothetical protein
MVLMGLRCFDGESIYPMGFIETEDHPNRKVLRVRERVREERVRGRRKKIKVRKKVAPEDRNVGSLKHIFK